MEFIIIFPFWEDGGFLFLLFNKLVLFGLAEFILNILEIPSFCILKVFIFLFSFNLDVCLLFENKGGNEFFLFF